MKAVGLTEYLPISDRNSRRDLEIERPIAKENDLLIQVEAILVNSIDTKVCGSKSETKPCILGWDAAGIMIEIGDRISLFENETALIYN